jgi:hypothetical protein
MANWNREKKAELEKRLKLRKEINIDGFSECIEAANPRSDCTPKPSFGCLKICLFIDRFSIAFAISFLLLHGRRKGGKNEGICFHSI